MSERHGWAMTSSGLFGSSEAFRGLVTMVDAILKRCHASLQKGLIGPSAGLIMAELKYERRFQFARMIRYASSVGAEAREGVDKETYQRQAMMVGVLKVLILGERDHILGGDSWFAAREIVKRLVREHGLAPQASFVRRWAIKLHSGGYICLIDGEPNSDPLLEEAQTFLSERDVRIFISRNPVFQQLHVAPVEVEVLEG